MGLSVIILAAGQGRRMRSSLPKILHKLAGRTLLEHVVTTARSLQPEQIIVVIGHGGDQVQATLSHLRVTWVTQAVQCGTGDAVRVALPHVTLGNQVLVLCGDVPLISQTTLRSLFTSTSAEGVGLVTATFDDAGNYGRILRDKQGAVMGVVEARDANATQRAIKEINTGIYLIPSMPLAKWLSQLTNNNSQHEWYLTDIIALAAKDKVTITAVRATHPHEVLGINDRKQLATLERIYQAMMMDSLMEQGVTLLDPSRVDLRGEVEVGEDVVVDINVIFKGYVRIGSDCHIGANVVLKNVTLGDHVRIEDFCQIDDAVIDDGCVIGPFARIRPDTHIKAHAKVGNFVEVKKSVLGENTKVNHLSYIGDTEIGRDTNIGAGVITCNYDGVNKHKTMIGNRVFVGSDCQLIAPVVIEDDAVVGAGSTITRTAPAGALTLSRTKQVTVPEWKRPVKKEK